MAPRVAGGRHAARDPFAAAVALGRFLSALHVPAPADAPTNPYRGVPLAEREPALRHRVAQLDGFVDGRRVLDLWGELVGVKPWAGPALWLHGDVHPLNVLVDEGRVSAIVDFGDLCSGDPASDLVVAWMMLPAPVHPTFRTAAANAFDPVDDDTWARARASALSYALAFLANSSDNPTMHALGERTLQAVLEDR
jgi:aminoglycoside phosphotransferase (APT) family kinase protein